MGVENRTVEISAYLRSLWIEWTGSALDPDWERVVLADLRLAPLSEFQPLLLKYGESSHPTLRGMRAVARAAADRHASKERRIRRHDPAWREKLTPADKDLLISLPLRERFPHVEQAAALAAGLRRKVASKAQHLAILHVMKYSFGDALYPADWTRFHADEVAAESGHSSEELELALWTAAVAGLVERKRIHGVWRYTVVPEVWRELPDYETADGAGAESQKASA
jgi:hypothetical protein